MVCNTQYLARLAAITYLSAVGTTLLAQTRLLAPDSAFFESGVFNNNRTYSAGVGASWNWSSWRTPWLGGAVLGRTEVLAVHLYTQRKADNTGDASNVTLLAVVPVLRYRFAQERSVYFVEGGIGASLTDRIYTTSDCQFSTRFNFYDVVSVGRNFGIDRKHELSLRLLHISNAGIKKPNPGENFLQLRYTATF